MTVSRIIVTGFFGLGMFFALLGSLGVYIMRDPYSRLQISSTCTTTSVISVIIGGMISYGFTPMTGKLFVILLFFLVSSPIATMIIARFAWESGTEAWRGRRKDR